MGDTVIIPVELNDDLGDYRFEKLFKHGKLSPEFLGESDMTDAFWMKYAGREAGVRNDAGEWVKMLASWTSGVIDHLGRERAWWAAGYFEFAKTGDFDFYGALADEPKGTTARYSFHVVANDAPVTVLMERFENTETNRSKTGRSEYTYTSRGSIGPGTVEVRVGDHIVLGCGGVPQVAEGAGGAGGKHGMGLAAVRPFELVGPYTAGQGAGLGRVPAVAR